MRTNYMFVSIHIRTTDEFGTSYLFKPSSIFLQTIPSRWLFCESFLCFVFVCHTDLSVPSSHVVTCWEGLAALLPCM